MSSTVLNDYRDQLRTSVLTLASSADRTITSSVYGDQTWGSEGSPEVTVIEAGSIGENNVFRTSGQSITGHGTLIIKHTCIPVNPLDLKWTGDVYVVGFNGDGSDLFNPDDLTATIDGNLVLLADTDNEASLELIGSSDVTNNGSLLCLAEANSKEAEVEVEDSSRLTVNGLLGLYGSRIELEASDSGTSLAVNGTMSIGMAQDVNRSDDFTFDFRGSVSLIYNEDLLSDALGGLGDLQLELGVEPTGGGGSSYGFGLAGTGGSHLSGESAAAEVSAHIAQHGTGSDYGVDFDGLGGSGQ